ncbi:MAG: hypothetical protein mread185_000052 [Mycoplasmataceae bacterium]|nr:MAG: hypothetical protein mread185_000052 [Mycoplasmataceae bacterium]
MAKQITEQNNEKLGNDYINKADYEYTLKHTFYNVTMLVVYASIYATFAYITVSYLKNKQQ